MDITIVETGTATTIQDHGRPTAAAHGVPPAGAVAIETAGAINAAVGNEPTAALLETSGGLVLTVSRPTVLASSHDGAVRRLDPGEQLTIAPDPARRWNYVAFAGGIDVVRVLGSASQDSRFGIGPLPLVAGSTLRLGAASTASPASDALLPTPPPADDPSAPFRFWPGPHLGELASGIDSLTGSAWTIQSIDRQSCLAFGLAQRVEPRPPSRLSYVPIGSVILDDSSLLSVAMPDHPTTTWGTVVGRIDRSDVGRLGQRPAGSPLRFQR